MQLSNIINKINNELVEAFDGSDEIFVSTTTQSGSIDVYVRRPRYSKDVEEFEVTVYHDDERERESKNLEAYITNSIYDWQTVEEEARELCMTEWEYNGFRDEADYNHYRYGS